MKRILALLMCVAMLAAVLVGCGGSPDDDGSDAGNSQPGGETPAGSGSEALIQDSRDDMITGTVWMEPAEAASYKDNFVIGGYTAMSTLDPQGPGNDTPSAGTFYKLAWETLLTVGENNELVPELAESWEQKDDLTWEFKLRQGVKFHNGEEFKASDVVFTVDRAKNLPGSYAGSLLTFIDNVEIVDEYTINFNLTAPYMDILLVLAEPTCAMLSEKALADDPDEGYKIGTGAWQVSSFLANDTCKFTRFDSYWGELPKISQMEYRYITENAARLIALQAGDIDVCTKAPTGELDELAAEGGYKIVTYPLANQMFVGFNLTNDVCADKNLRLAIAHAINKADVAYVVADGFAKLGETAWGNCTFGYNDDIEGYEYNPELAKKYLADAGYPDGLDIEICAAFPGHVAAAAVVQSQLGEIGINVTVNEMDYPGLASYTNWGNPQHEVILFTNTGTMYADGSRMYLYPGQSWNINGTADERITELLDLAIAEKDEQARLDMYAEVQQIVHDNVMYIPLYYSIDSAVMGDNVGGIMWTEIGYHDFTYACVAE